MTAPPLPPPMPPPPTGPPRAGSERRIAPTWSPVQRLAICVGAAATSVVGCFVVGIATLTYGSIDVFKTPGAVVAYPLYPAPVLFLVLLAPLRHRLWHAAVVGGLTAFAILGGERIAPHLADPTLSETCPRMSGCPVVAAQPACRIGSLFTAALLVSVYLVAIAISRRVPPGP